LSSATIDLSFLRSTLTLLRSAGLDVVVFGGWAEELCGLREPGAHSDVDLLYFGDGFDPLDRLLGTVPDLAGIREKRLPHKRAFVSQGVRVELFLVSRDEQGLFTPFWGTKRYRWPRDTRGGIIDGLPVAAPSALIAYRSDYDQLMNAFPCEPSATYGTN
jgi:hypothetical protein